MRTLYLPVLAEELEAPANDALRRALAEAKRRGAEIVAVTGAPISVGAPEDVLERVLAALSGA
jgi:hypothetical protein